MIPKFYFFAPLALLACAPADQQALTQVKGSIATQLEALSVASSALCAAAPEPKATGWDPTVDGAAIDSMKKQWLLTRDSYEQVEGAVAVLFNDLDAATDQRYDDAVEAGVDSNLFDDVGFTGMHAIERILWASWIPEQVTHFEQSLGDRYIAPAFPANQQQADDFKNKLCARLVRDVKQMKADFTPLALDAASAYRGTVGSMHEQLEKVTNASTGAEESRYAQTTLRDMRSNLAGAKATYEAFRPWLAQKSQSATDARIVAGLKRVQAAYDSISADAIPAPPATWSSVHPSDADLATDFGKLYSVLLRETDVKVEGSLVYDMTAAADALAIPRLPGN